MFVKCRFETNYLDFTFTIVIVFLPVKAHVYSFILILNVDHITKIQEFFTTESDRPTGAGPSTAVKASKKYEPVSQVSSVWY